MEERYLPSDRSLSTVPSRKIIRPTNFLSGQNMTRLFVNRIPSGARHEQTDATNELRRRQTERVTTHRRDDDQVAGLRRELQEFAFTSGDFEDAFARDREAHFV